MNDYACSEHGHALLVLLIAGPVLCQEAADLTNDACGCSIHSRCPASLITARRGRWGSSRATQALWQSESR
jgi:hypothetical protein